MRWLCLCLCLLSGCSQTDQKAETKAIEIPVLTHGKVIDLDAHVEKGKITLFDFYADWCPPCKKLDLSLKDMQRIYANKLVIKKLDIIDWESELTKHQGIKDLPYLVVYDKEGKLLKQGPSAEVLPELIQLLGK